MALPDKNYQNKDFLFNGRLILKLYDFSCAICGNCRDWMEIHHIDKKNDNNEPENLIPVCKDCHMIVHGGKFKLRLCVDEKVLEKFREIEKMLNDPPIKRKC